MATIHQTNLAFAKLELTGLQPVEDLWGMFPHRWLGQFDAQYVLDPNTVLLAKVHAGDDRIEVRVCTADGAEKHSPISFSLNAVGVEMLAAMVAGLRAAR